MQTMLGVMRPVEARLEMRERYGAVYKSNDALAGELFHIADRELIERMFKWKPAQYNVERAAGGHGARHRAVLHPVAGDGIRICGCAS